MRFPAACGSRLPGKNNPYSAAPSKQSMPRAIRAVVWSKCPPFSSQKRTGICFAQCAASKRVHASPCAMRGLPVRLFPVPYAKGQTHRRSRLDLGPVRKSIIPQGAGKAANSLHRHPPQPCIYREKPRQRISGPGSFPSPETPPGAPTFPAVP